MSNLEQFELAFLKQFYDIKEANKLMIHLMEKFSNIDIKSSSLEDAMGYIASQTKKSSYKKYFNLDRLSDELKQQLVYQYPYLKNSDKIKLLLDYSFLMIVIYYHLPHIERILKDEK